MREFQERKRHNPQRQSEGLTLETNTDESLRYLFTVVVWHQMLAFHLPIKQHCSSLGNNIDVLNNYPLLPRVLGADILQLSPPLA